MKIAMIASEANPFAKTGGLADVSAALSLALERLGHQVTLIIPAYRSALQGDFALKDSGMTLSVPLSDRRGTGIGAPDHHRQFSHRLSHPRR